MKPYFLRKTIYTSKDPEWAERYLTSQSDRITAILRQDLGNDFWENYARVFRQYCQSGRLMFRAKCIDSKAMMLVQIWQTAEDHKNFELEAIRGINLKRLLNNQGLDIKAETGTITEDKVFEFVSSLRRCDHLIQHIIPKWKTADMIVGDPLKKGKNYLPFPEKA